MNFNAIKLFWQEINENKGANMVLYDIKDMILELRKNGFTQEAIATAIKVNQSMISRICAGKYKKINLDLTLKIQKLHTKYCQKEKIISETTRKDSLNGIKRLFKNVLSKLNGLSI